MAYRLARRSGWFASKCRNEPRRAQWSVGRPTPAGSLHNQMAIGAGAILQVIVEVISMQMRQEAKGAGSLLAPTAMAGLAVGIGFMYVTAMLVNI